MLCMIQCRCGVYGLPTLPLLKVACFGLVVLLAFVARALAITADLVCRVDKTQWNVSEDRAREAECRPP